MLNPSPNSDRTYVDQYNAAQVDGDMYAHDSDNAMNSGSSFRGNDESDHSLPPFPWNVRHGRPSTDISSLEYQFEPNPRLSRLRKLEMSLASTVQADYYALSDHSAPAAMQKLTESEIYSRLLLKRRYGYPLYRPEPLEDLSAEYRRKGVQIGDVGRITPDGAFDFLFNVDSAQPNTINPPTLPWDFEKVPPIQVTPEVYFRPGAQIFSDHVAEIRNKPIITYNCLAPEGVVLHLPENTVLFKAQNKDELYDLAARHAHNWYEYLVINKPQEIVNGSLYLVTDCIKTTNWGVGVFNNNHRVDCDYLEFVSEDQGPRRRYGWRTLGSIVAKVAPAPADDTSANISELNQCIFLLGFKIALGQRLWTNLQYRALSRSSMRTSSGLSYSYSNNSRFSGNSAYSIPGSTYLSHSPIHARGDSEGQDALARLEGRSISTSSHPVLLQQVPGATCPVHPSDFINAMLLLHEPDADVAIMHDDEWCDLLPNNFAVDPRRLEIKDFLENVVESRISTMDQHGCVSLKKPGVNWADDSRTDIPARASSELLPSRSQGEIIGNLDQARLSSQDALYNNPLVPTTAATVELCPKFRILLVGRSGVGKSSLINSIFKTSLTVEDHKAGAASIEREIMSPHNEYLVVHDSEGYEPGDPRKFEVIKKFITKRCNAKNFSEKLHAVWLCITIPFGNGRVLETGDEEICSLKQLGVPVIIVFTKYDLLLSVAKRELMNRGLAGNGEELITETQYSARRKFEAQCIPPLTKLADKVPGKIPYICVSTRYGDSLPKLVQITLKNISIPKHPQQTKPFLRRLSEGISKKKMGIPDEDHTVSPTESYSDPRTLMLVFAQRVDINSKLAASISIGKRKYWSGLASGFHFRNSTIWHCLKVIHTDIINVWNIRGLHQYLLSDGFREKISIIVGELRPDVPGQRWTTTNLAELLTEAGNKVVSAGPAAVVMAPVAAAVALAAWVHEIYKQAPHIIRCFMGYIVDLTMIMQTLFKIPIQDRDGNIIGIETTRVEEILDNFAASPIKDTVHDEIRTFVDGLKSRFEKDAIIDKIDSLIYSNKDAQL